VFVEYTVNDLSAINGDVEEVMDTQKRRGTERLLRRLLTFDNSPAVIVLHTWAPKVSLAKIQFCYKTGSADVEMLHQCSCCCSG
jgi:hypothetical protein